MVEQNKYKRAIFPEEKQREFLLKAKKQLSISWNDFGKLLNITGRNLIDWKNEKISMSLRAIETICQKTNLDFPKDVEIKDQYWYTKKAAKLGGQATMKKYGKIGGDEKKRKEKWREWWETKGKFLEKSITNPWPFKKPKKDSALAEFVGIVLGDGGISQKQIFITLNRVTDKAYAIFVKNLIKKLFDVRAGVFQNKKYLADDISISRVGIVKFLVDDVGLKIGNKIRNKVDIPNWIKKDKQLQSACLRGLVDTDGSVFVHKYVSRGKQYSYKKISYCSRSPLLLKSASNILKGLKIKHRVTKNNFEIRIESQKDVKKYFDLINSSNPKHLKRYKN